MGCASSTASGANKTHVDLSEKDLTELPSIPVATTVLNCSSNKLAALPSTIGDLKALEELDASANQLTSLPAEIDQCEKLEVSQACSQSLGTAPKHCIVALFSHFTIPVCRGQKLMLFANKIKELPPKFPPALTELNLFNNAVKKLPPCIGELTALQEVNVAANKLMMTSDAMFASWGCVTVLNMYDNNLVRFGSIAPMSSLVELRLSGNNLEAMPTLGQHAALKIMEIHKNRISASSPDNVALPLPSHISHHDLAAPSDSMRLLRRSCVRHYSRRIF